jgi:preprotein translocase subunit SecE
VARDRKRAKQRRERGGRAGGARGAQATSSGQHQDGKLEREDVPGALDHGSSDVDEFDAALVRGAGGVPVPESVPGTEDSEGDAEDELQELQPVDGGPARPAAVGARTSGAPLRGGNRVVGFIGASWAELQRVQWPDRRQVTQATAVVLGFVAIAGAYLGVADYVAKEIVEFIL